LFAPAGTDRSIIQRAHRETAEVLNQRELRQKFADSGMKTLALGPEEFAKFLDGEGRKYSELVRAAEIRTE
jgi:tripartite-type tricarboxylate transporter receptor subunit TctC